MPVAACNGVDLYYERSGTGPTLLYCNGSGSSLASTRPLITLLSSRFQLAAFDYRGMGASAPVSAAYTMADVARDVAALLDVLGWERTALLGLSFGGMVAQEFAVTFPDRLTRLCLLATSPGGPLPSYPLETLVDLPDDERAARARELTDRRWTPEWLATHRDQAALASALTPDTSTSAVGSPDTETQAADTQAAGRAYQLQARKGHDVLDRLSRIDCPTFVGAGRYDGIAPAANGKAIADRVPDATLHVYDGGHLFIVQDPNAWPEAADFLTG